MAGKPFNAFDRRVHTHIFTEEAHLLRTVQQHAAERTFRLISGKDNRRIRAIQVVLQMVADAPCIAHAGR